MSNLRERARELAREALTSAATSSDRVAAIEQYILAGMREALGEPDDGMLEAGEEEFDSYSIWTAMARKRLESIGE